MNYSRQSSSKSDDSQENNTATIPTIIFLTDGSELIGTIVSEDSLTISFQTMSKIAMIIPRDQVKELRHLQGVIIDDAYYRYDPNVTRLFFAPTARPLAKGQGCFSAYQVFFPFLAYEVNDFLTIGGGISLLPGASEQLLYVTPKIVPYKKEDLYVAAGILYINSTGGEFGGGGILYSITTYGTPRASITGGLG